MKDQASYIIVDGKPKRRSVQQTAPTECGPSGNKYQSNYIYINIYHGDFQNFDFFGFYGPFCVQNWQKI